MPKVLFYYATNMSDLVKESIAILIELGFNDLEANVYTFLVENSPVTAYRVAQGIGKPVANTYKAVESLREKGAVLIDETGNKLCRAVTPEEFLQKMENRFHRQQEKAKEVLSRLRPVEGDDGIYSLSTSQEVFDTCAMMFQRAEEVIIIDAFPLVLDRLKKDLQVASKNGVRVVAQTYSPVELPEIYHTVSGTADSVFDRWAGQWLCVVIDGGEYLFAYLNEDASAVFQAIWSRSAFLAWIQYGNMAYSFLASELEQLIKQNAPVEKLKEVLQKKEVWFKTDLKGYRSLRSRFSHEFSDEAL